MIDVGKQFLVTVACGVGIALLVLLCILTGRLIVAIGGLGIGDTLGYVAVGFWFWFLATIPIGAIARRAAR